VSLTFANGLFDQIDSSMVLVGRDFITDQVPDAFLHIEFRMVRRQIFQFDVGMDTKEFMHPRALVPGGSIDVEIDFSFLHPSTEVF